MLEERAVPDPLPQEAVESALARLRGPILQRPPAYSAKKQDGERAYAKARRGEVVELEPVEVTVHELEATRIESPEIDFSTRVSTGTYVRAMGRDLGDELGAGGHLTALRRTSIGSLRVEDAVSLEEMVDWGGAPPGDHPAFRTPLEALSHLPGRELDREEMIHLAHGRPVSWDAAPADPAIVHAGGSLLAVGRTVDGTFRPRKVFLTPAEVTP